MERGRENSRFPVEEGFGKPWATNFLYLLMLENGSTLVVFPSHSCPHTRTKTAFLKAVFLTFAWEVSKLQKFLFHKLHIIRYIV